MCGSLRGWMKLIRLKAIRRSWLIKVSAGKDMAECFRFHSIAQQDCGLFVKAGSFPY
jgi:hypothetical protein